jgi:hypothetical protein
MARKDYQTYEPGTTVNFRPTQYGRDYKHKTKWYKYIPGYLAMLPAAALTTVIVTVLHINVVVQMVLVVGLAFVAKFWVDWKLRV